MWGLLKKLFLLPFRLLKKLIPQRLKDLIPLGIVKVKSSLQLQLIIAFSVCLAASTIVAAIAKPLTVSRYAVLEYKYSIADIDRQAREMVSEIREIEEHGVESHIYQRAVEYYQQNPTKLKGEAHQASAPAQPVADQQQAPILTQQAMPSPSPAPANPANQETIQQQAPTQTQQVKPASPPASTNQGTVQQQAPAQKQRSAGIPLLLPVPVPTQQTESNIPPLEEEQMQPYTGQLPSLTKGQVIQAVVEQFSDSDLKVLLTDLDGKVELRSDEATENQVDLHTIIQNAMEQRSDDIEFQGAGEYTSFYPVSIGEEKMYLITTGIPRPDIIYQENSNIIPVLIAFAAFILCFYMITRKRMKEIGVLADGLREMAKGDLNYRVPERSQDELGSLAVNINTMAAQLQNKIEEERKAERTKNELITNVSHDLRTPLTSVIGYLRLLKDKKYDKDEHLEQYIDIVYAKSERMVKLVESLFEYTKLADESLKLSKENVCLNDMLNQLTDELQPLAERHEVSFEKHFPPQKVMVRLDPDKMARAFENLLMNAIKYSLKPGVITLHIKDDSETSSMIHFSIANACEEIDATQIQQLFDRFYRLDTSRSSDTGGSGLGLAITKSIIEHHKGSISANYQDGMITFIMNLPLL